MIVAIASGKGGTGKTTVAVNLAMAWGTDVQLVDCDVEEPNARIFLKPEISRTEAVSVAVPEVNESLCTACGLCSQMCRYNAIAALGAKALVFPEMCHSCGGCALVCPEKAITEKDRVIGTLDIGQRGKVRFVEGRLNVGEAMAPPMIRAARRTINNEVPAIIDCPPGTSCPVVAALRGADVALLVTEPTPFGLHDLTLAVETVRQLRIPLGVVLNRVGAGDDRVHAYCARERIPILLEIPDDRRIAEAYSRGELIITALPEYASAFSRLMRSITQTLEKANRFG